MTEYEGKMVPHIFLKNFSKKYLTIYIPRDMMYHVKRSIPNYDVSHKRRYHMKGGMYG